MFEPQITVNEILAATALFGPIILTKTEDEDTHSRCAEFEQKFDSKTYRVT